MHRVKVNPPRVKGVKEGRAGDVVQVKEVFSLAWAICWAHTGIQDAKSKEKKATSVLPGDNTLFLYHAIPVHFLLAIQVGIGCYISGKCWHIRADDLCFLRDVYAAFSEGGGFDTVMHVNSLEILGF